jgi:hypothetical protein
LRVIYISGPGDFPQRESTKKPMILGDAGVHT